MKQLILPELRQTYEWDCGAKAIETVLVYYGIEIREEIIIKYANTNPKIGTLISDMKKTLKKFKLKFDAKSITIEDLKNYINKEIPVIILLQAWNGKSIDYTNDFHDGHRVVVIGYDKNKIIFEDPYSFERTFLSNKELEKRRHAKDNGEKIFNYGIAVFGKDHKYNPNKIIHMD